LQASLNHYVPDTSREAYHKLEQKDSQCALMLELYQAHPQGFTDDEMRRSLARRGVVVPNSTVSARRNDINRFVGKALIVTDAKKMNISGRRALVWVFNKYCGGICYGKEK